MEGRGEGGRGGGGRGEGELEGKETFLCVIIDWRSWEMVLSSSPTTPRSNSLSCTKLHIALCLSIKYY